MDLNFTAADEAFRGEARAFIDSKLPADLRDKVLEGKRLQKDDYFRWHVALHEQGWVAANWPQEFGGPGWNAAQQHIFEEECADAGAPILSPFGLRMVAPVIMAFASPAQQQYYLPRIRSGEHWWCQGYSEPGSGSDLASLRTRAERVGDKYIVNGQKTWTTLGHHANWIFCLVRTNAEARKQEGISFLLIDMNTPGITVRPIIMIDGEHEVNEVWFENVEVPVGNLIGEENKGWTYAKYLLGHERTNIAEVGRSKRRLKRLKEIAAQQPGSDGRPLLQDVRFRDRIAQVEIELMALEITNLRVIAADMEKRAPGPEASLLKIRGSEIQQTLTELMMQALGHDALPLQHAAMDYGYDGELTGPDYGVPLSGQYFNFRKTTIYGGSNEIQRNIISKMILGF
ncbi:pimeloyl-CoA dehydrogenase large subunit [Solimonas sp. K1W22B-7]|uniref:acyl-CoA dehydrogenase family protein n=1 Tax=Solimonas sp. K1W22B-7 TaxID=2303331 RepID=UPI000E335279|nr:acyl-CoA dehydrogenase family protein [Solimonas sp. K1W22B-7]AXQ28161.1 pimeloyl-CoA dehydrogenase large subunit [Solimonas sp. K1W22B-7]